MPAPVLSRLTLLQRLGYTPARSTTHALASPQTLQINESAPCIGKKVFRSMPIMCPSLVVCSPQTVNSRKQNVFSQWSRRLRTAALRSVILCLTILLVLGPIGLLPSTAFGQNNKIQLNGSAISPTQIRLTWTLTNPGPLAMVRIYRAANPELTDLSVVGATPPAVFSFVDSNLTPQATYYYVLKTVSAAGGLESQPSSVVTITMPAATAPNPRPTPSTSRDPMPSRTPPDVPTVPNDSLPVPIRTLYVSPQGKATNNGSVDRPLDLATALSSEGPARPGDALMLRGGSYSLAGAKLSGTDQPPFLSRLTGTAAAPIQVRQYPGERAVIDGGVRIEGAYTYYIDFEVSNSNTDRTKVRPTGLNVFGHHLKLINLIIHDCGDAIGFWQSATDSEVYGSILYRNGWEAAGDPRGNGHGIYIQNKDGAKRIADNISFDNYATGMKAYTEAGYIIGIKFEGNISFNNGSTAIPRPTNDRLNNLLAGSAINPADRIELINNYTYQPLSSKGPNLQLGYTAERNKAAVIRDNYFVGGSTTLGYISNWETLEVTGNTFIGNQELLVVNTPVGKTVANYTWNRNTYYSSGSAIPIGYKPGGGDGRNYSVEDWQRATGVDGGSQKLAGKPSSPKIVVRQNQYAPGRLHIAVYNWQLRETVAVDASRYLRKGDRYEVRNAQDYFGAPVMTGVFDGNALPLPMKTGARSAPEFNAYVLNVLGKGSGTPALRSSSWRIFRPIPGGLSAASSVPDNSPIISQPLAPAAVKPEISIDPEERRLLELIDGYRRAEGLGPLGASIALTRASEWMTLDMARYGYLGERDALGRGAKERARAFGFPGESAPAEEASLSAAGALDARRVLEQWASTEPGRRTLQNPVWKRAGVARLFDPQTETWRWNLTLGAYWDKTVPLAGEDDEGLIDRNPLVRTRPPQESLVAGRRFSGYGDDGRPYSAVHCDLDAPSPLCWRDPPPQINAGLAFPSSADQVIGAWKAAFTINSNGVVHANTPGFDRAAFSMELLLEADGRWSMKGYRPFQHPGVEDSGVWRLSRDPETREDIITFFRVSGSPRASIPLHAAPGRLTLFAVDGGAFMKNFLRGWASAEADRASAPQIIFLPKD
jgi:uncharacterized protein YkwD